MEAKEKALFVAELAKAKLADDVVVLDMRKICNITEFFIIATSASTRRAQTITDSIEHGLFKKGCSICGIEGYSEGKWVLVDAYDVVAHVFEKNLRSFYNLEGLWSDASRVRLCHTKRKKRSKKTSKRK